jgi:hypothetical protein
MRELDVRFGEAPRLAGTLLLPVASERKPVPAMLLLGGTGGDTRDGEINPALFPPGHQPPQRGTLRRLAQALAAAGIASLRCDKRGVGASEGDFASSDYDTDLADNTAAFRFLQSRAEVDASRVGVAGHSAGAFNACLLCRDIPEIACAGLLGALHEPIDSLVLRNWPRIAQWWDHFSDAQRAWLIENRPREVVAAYGMEEFIRAARAGEPSVELSAHGQTATFHTARFIQDLERPVAFEFRHVRCPALVLHGGADLNVRPADALDTYRRLTIEGNEEVTLAIIPGLEHSFLETPRSMVERVWERVSLESWARPTSALALDCWASWARRVLKAA